jgi:hypothetical protein
MREKLTWEELAKLQTADEVAALMRQHNITGSRNNAAGNPLEKQHHSQYMRREQLSRKISASLFAF